MNYGEALKALRVGASIRRAGWNGKGMFVWLVRGAIAGDTEPQALIGGVPLHLFDIGDNGIVTRMPNLNMRAVDGSTVVGWLASQTDMLAEDWEIV